MAGIFAWVETDSIVLSSDIKKSSRLIVKSADARCWKKIEKKLHQTGLAPVKQKASISDNKKEYWTKGINSFLSAQGLFSISYIHRCRIYSYELMADVIDDLYVMHRASAAVV